MGLYGYPIAGYGDVCMPDDLDKAWGMLFESEAWPPRFRVKYNIDMLFDSKGSGSESAAPSRYSTHRHWVSAWVHDRIRRMDFNDSNPEIWKIQGGVFLSPT